jgi:ParB family chromosome partitioning protein
MLGKGLEALIPNKTEAPAAPVAAPANDWQGSQRKTPSAPPHESVYHIEVDKISPNPHQPRRDFNEAELQELAASIREFGVLQPLIVTKIERDMDYGTGVEYQLVAGERRLRAARLAGLPRVPAIVRATPTAKESLEMAVVENIQRADLNPIETARSYAKLQEQFGLTQREVAARMGKSREVVANALRLLNLPTAMQDAIAQNKMSESQGRILLAVSDPAQQQQIFEQVTTNNMSVRELRNTVARMQKPIIATPAVAPAALHTQAPMPVPQGEFVRLGAEQDEYQALARELQATLRAPVRIERAGNGGRVMIDIANEDDLRALILKISRLDENF